MARPNTALTLTALLTSTLATFFASPLAAQLGNGGFEVGDLSGWVAGGIGTVEVIQAADFSPNVLPSEGSFMALLSSGPGDLGGAAGDFDSNGINDFDSTTLSLTFDVQAAPANLSFQWSFLTSEENQPANFDDFFLVTLDGATVLARSSAKPGGVSPFADTPPYDGISYTSNAPGPTGGSVFDDGRTSFASACIAIPTTGTHTLTIRLADQGDRLFDSGLLIDNAQVPSACDASINQLTDTAGAFVEIKGGGFEVRSQSSRSVASSEDGRVLAFVSNGDLTGDNPNVQTQLFVAADGGFERLTAMVGGQVESPAMTNNGRWVVFAAGGDLVPGNPGNVDGNLEIFRFDRQLGDMTQVTDTALCSNRHPSVSHDNQGRRVAFATDCTDLLPGFNLDGNSEVVIWDANNGTFQTEESTGCTNRDPVISRNNQGRFVAFVSDCDLTGANADGNFEIFQWNRQTGGNPFEQVTVTSAGVANDVPATDTSGRYVSFVSSSDLVGNNADGNLEIFRWDGNNGNFLQLTDTAGTVLHLSAALDDSGQFAAFERFDLLSGTSAVGWIGVASGQETVLASGDAALPAIGVDGGAPVVAFQAGGDFGGGNGDGNREIWTTSPAFTQVPVNTFCRTPSLAIPDNAPAGTTDMLTVSSASVIADLEVRILAEHTYVGDLIFSLEHVDTGTSVVLIDRPGFAGTGFGCGGNDLDTVLDDAAATPVEDQCAAAVPTIDGTFRPNGSLAAFLAESYGGAWALTVSDNVGADTGTLLEWCLIFDPAP